MMQVIKSTGEIEKFNPKKIKRSIIEAGGSTRIANKAVKEVKKNYSEKTTTKEILELIINVLKEEPGLAEKYDLKRAIMSLGPSGFPFEEFFGALLRHYGYKTTVGNKVKGKNIFHEVDVIAIKEKKGMVECKYHNERGTITKLKPAMYTYARFLDIKKNGFNYPWLVTNTKCSHDAIDYARGNNLKITSWKFPRKESLEFLIENKKLYPITILKNLNQNTKEALYRSKIMIAKDLLNFEIDELQQKTGLSIKELNKIIEETKQIIS
jgi:hypothetical protein